MTERVHRVAEAGYTENAESYERARPGYPPATVDWALAELVVPPGATTLDVGAGTGKLTRELVARGLDVTAVEPVEAMRELLRRNLPTVRVLDGTAERLPIENGAAAFAAVGTAFHWFDAAPATRELARALSSGAGLFLVWNVRDLDDPFMARLAQIQNRWRQAQAKLPFSLDSEAARGILPGAGFEPAGQRTDRQTQALDRSGLLDRMRSISYVGAMAPEQRERELDVVRAFLDSEGVRRDSDAVEMRYVVRSFLFRRR